MIGGQFGALTAAQQGLNYSSGYYYFASPPGANGTSAVLGNGNLMVSPWIIPRQMTLAFIGGEITAAGDAPSTLHIGVYASDPVSGMPSTLAQDVGTISGGAVSVTDVASGLTLTPGVWWFGAAVQNVTTTQPTVRTTGNASPIPVRIGTTTPGAGYAGFGYQMNAVTGAMPTTFVANTFSFGVPRIHFKVQ